MGRYLRSVRHRALIATIVEAREATGLSQREFAKKLKSDEQLRVADRGG